MQYGGTAYLHEAGVAVYSKVAGFIGDDVALVHWLMQNNVNGVADATNSINGKGANYDVAAAEAYRATLHESGRTFAFLELSFDGSSIGRLLFELYPELAPKTCENFLALCEKGEGGYAGTPIHRIKAGGWLQGGDVVTGNGDGGASAAGGALADESFSIAHDHFGVLGMANVGPHTATSQFYCTFAACPSFDKNYVAFGKLVDGSKLLRFIEAIETANDRPRAELLIAACGPATALSGEDAEAADEEEDAAAAKLQALHRARLARKEMQEQKEAAKRVQAAKRGQQARRERREQVEAATKMQAISRGRKSRAAGKK